MAFLDERMGESAVKNLFMRSVYGGFILQLLVLLTELLKLREGFLRQEYKKKR